MRACGFTRFSELDVLVKSKIEEGTLGELCLYEEVNGLKDSEVSSGRSCVLGASLTQILSPEVGLPGSFPQLWGRRPRR